MRSPARNWNRLRGRDWALVMVLAAGCGFRLGYDELAACEGTACTVDPSPVTPDDDGDAAWPRPGDGAVSPWDGDSGDGRGDGGYDGGRRCGSSYALHDSFDGADEVLGWVGRWYGGARIAHRNDRIEFDLGEADGEAIYRTNQAYDLRDAALAIEVGAGGQRTGVALREGAIERMDGVVEPLRGGVAFEIEDGNLNVLTLDGEARYVRARVPHDSVAHRHLRFRESAGVLTFQASADRVTWTDVDALPHALDASALRVELYARGPGRTPWFDRVNDDGDFDFCGPSHLYDDFGDGVVAPAWKRWYGAGECVIDEREGALALTLEPSQLTLCGLVSSNFIDFRQTSLSVRVEAPETGSAFVDVSRFSYGTDHETDRAVFQVSAGNLRMFISHKPSPTENATNSFEQVTTYEPAQHRYVRLREADGRALWETSPDGVNFTNQAEAPLPFDTHAVLVTLGAQRGQGDGASEVRFDDVSE